MKNKLIRLFCMLIACLLLTGSLASAQEAGSLKDDFYDAVNAEWMATAEIPADQYATGGFYDIGTEVEALLMADAQGWLENGLTENDALLNQFVLYYAMVTDHEKREADGMAPLKPYIERIDALESLGEYGAGLADWMVSGNAAPLSLSVMADMKDAQNNALYAGAASIILPDPSYYDTDNQTGAMLLSIYSDMLKQLWTLYGLSEEEAAAVVQETMEFDALLVPYALTAEESSDFETLYNPISFEDFCAKGGDIDFAALLTELLGQEPDQIILTHTKFFDAFSEIVNEETFPLIKSWMKSMTLYSTSPYLTNAFYETANIYAMTMSGQTEMSPQDKTDYRNALGMFSEAIGVYYGRTYFGEEARADVTGMVHKMIEVYKGRLESNDWLGDETKAEALKKLDGMSIHIGYPDEIPAYYPLLIVDDTKNLLDNAFAFSAIMLGDHFAQWGEPVNRNYWPLSASTVNAMYQPLTNTITFPAAILQAPFYSIEQSASANYGGIGAVIAHEISHAFDPNGSKFDEYGNMREWWTEEDYARFEALAQAMVEEFDGLEFAGGAVNGKLTKGENVADAGGLRCALEVVKGLEDGDLEAFFTNWATIWRSKYTPEIQQVLLTVDTHSPDKLRANIQLQNTPEFFETFGIAEGDGMWRAPEDRVAIW